MLSLFLQAFLVSFAPLRRRSKSKLLQFSVWQAYLLADWVAAVAIGLITESQTDLCRPNAYGDLFAFWASFFLLHLGGPDSITSFALEDNEFWLRHFFGLILQVLAAAYSIYLTLPNNKLWLPTMLVFFVGTIKYGERTCALYLASFERFGATSLPRPEPGPDYEEAVAARFNSSISASAPTQENNISTSERFGATSLPTPEPGPNYEEAVAARSNSSVSASASTQEKKISTGESFGATSLPRPEPGPDYEEAVAAIFNSSISASAPTQENNISTGSCSLSNPQLDDAKLLQAAYELFQSSKGLVVGFILSPEHRELSQKLFLNSDPTNAFKVVEYELSMLYEALHTKVVVARRLIRFLSRLFSFFSIVGSCIFFFLVEKHDDEFGSQFNIGLTYALLIAAIILDAISFFQLISSDSTLGSLGEMSLRKFIPSILKKSKRWSNSVLQYNMISYSLDERPVWIYKVAGFLHARAILDKIKIATFSSSENLTEDVKEYIFKYLRRRTSEVIPLLKSENKIQQVEDSEEEVFQQRLDVSVFRNFLKSFTGAGERSRRGTGDFAVQFLSCHLAAQIYCHEDKSTNSDHERKGKRILKLLSDYMFYLMVAKSSLLSPLSFDLEEMLEDTLAEANKFFDKNEASQPLKACEKIKKDFGREFPYNRRTNSSRESVFSRVCDFAAEMLSSLSEQELKDKCVDLLAKAAIICRPMEHAKQLSKGGELLAFIWLLTNHFGINVPEYLTLS